MKVHIGKKPCLKKCTMLIAFRTILQVKCLVLKRIEKVSDIIFYLPPPYPMPETTK